MQAATHESQFVTLCLGAEVFAVPVSMVREILDYRDSFRIPEGPDYLLGLIDVRGRGTPVIDLRSKLGMAKVPPDSATRIMVLDVPLADRTLALGLVADRVLEVATFADDQIEGAPDVGVAWRSDYIAGVVRRESGFVVLFNLSKLLTADVAILASSAAKAA
ncbi:chemotaxis protein CheW [Rhizomicrobium electricum]|jgi:purine-binding chemotaxis protein CheW|uniref:Chemotaxis protein CheW n=1 Tax=Rhizomicrobium electricum TaxID=480070 RepID=A0ABN1F1U3_9PROT|nr:chemotaxis protein CheW [Rhizomicrobium electricum]NIJ50318.1 purine-binding chemotaxis protein CheW [Rhizomicrobium electricum]